MTIVKIPVFVVLIWQQSVSVSQDFKSYIVYGHYFDIQSYEINITIVLDESNLQQQ